ncbi:MAG: hypothetical protein K6F00_11215 [Lachnospiraceae bacterium]|nr:hypothetical protein [Lachnospiraceae bacterium]
MKEAVFINGNRNGYAPSQCENTCTVEELIEFLQDYNPKAKVFLRNDEGYTYGSIDIDDIYSGKYNEDKTIID